MEASRASLRQEFREVRLGFSKNSGAVVRTALKSNILRLLVDLTSEGDEIGAYSPTPEEAQFSDLPDNNYFFPRIEGEELHFYRPSGPMIKNHLNILEPDSSSKPMTSGRLILTPAVAVDSVGNRLGMGGGYYDRFFARHSDCIRVGVVYQVQVSRHPLPAESWDQPLDWIVTENMILRTPRRSS